MICGIQQHSLPTLFTSNNNCDRFNIRKSSNNLIRLSFSNINRKDYPCKTIRMSRNYCTLTLMLPLKLPVCCRAH